MNAWDSMALPQWLDISLCIVLCAAAIGAGVGALMRTDALVDWMLLPSPPGWKRLPAESVRFFRNYLRLVAVVLVAAGAASAWKVVTWFGLV